LCTSWAECGLPASIGAKETETRLQSIWKMNIHPDRLNLCSNVSNVLMHPSVSNSFNSLQNVNCEKQDNNLLIGKIQSQASKGLLGMITK